MENNKTPKPDKEDFEDEEFLNNNFKDLAFNEDENSFELDVSSNELVEEGYIHPDPYDTVAENGKDAFSDFDEANQYVGNEYDKDLSIENDADNLGLRIVSEGSIKVNKIDKEISETDEDKRNDLDEEGYPVKE